MLMMMMVVIIRICYCCFDVVASKPCLEMKEIAELDRLLDDAYKGGMRINKASGRLEQITNWDIQSTIFLALQVMGSVGKSTMRTIYIENLRNYFTRESLLYNLALSFS